MRNGLLLFSLLVISLFSSVSVIADNPPTFDNEQFYGSVTWVKSAVAPTSINIKIVSTGKVYSSVIKNVVCGDKQCVGKYGYDKDNILRVQAVEGAELAFSIGAVEVKKINYKAGDIVKLDLPEGSVFGATNETSSNDSNVNTSVNNQTSNDTSSSTTTPPKKYYPVDEPTPKSSSSVVAASCKQNWNCGIWGDCVNSVEVRTCFRSDTCDVQLKEGKVKSVVSMPKPSESRSCIMPSSGVQEEAPSYVPPVEEERYVAPVVQKPTLPKKESVSFVQSIIQSENFNYYLYGVLGFLALVGIGVAVFFFTRGSGLDEGTRDELEGVYSAMESKGLTDEEITSRLIGKGWDEKVVNKFLKKR